MLRDQPQADAIYYVLRTTGMFPLDEYFQFSKKHFLLTLPFLAVTLLSVLEGILYPRLLGGGIVQSIFNLMQKVFTLGNVFGYIVLLIYKRNSLYNIIRNIQRISEVTKSVNLNKSRWEEYFRVFPIIVLKLTLICTTSVPFYYHYNLSALDLLSQLTNYLITLSLVCQISVILGLFKYFYKCILYFDSCEQSIVWYEYLTGLCEDFHELYQFPVLIVIAMLFSYSTMHLYAILLPLSEKLWVTLFFSAWLPLMFWENLEIISAFRSIVREVTKADNSLYIYYCLIIHAFIISSNQERAVFCKSTIIIILSIKYNK